MGLEARPLTAPDEPVDVCGLSQMGHPGFVGQWYLQKVVLVMLQKAAFFEACAAFEPFLDVEGEGTGLPARMMFGLVILTAAALGVAHFHLDLGRSWRYRSLSQWKSR